MAQKKKKTGYQDVGGVNRWIKGNLAPKPKARPSKDPVPANPNRGLGKKGNLQDVSGVNRRIKGDLQDVSGVNRGIKGDLQDVSGVNRWIKGNLQDVSGVNRRIKGNLQDVSGVNRRIKGDLQDVSGVNRRIKGDLAPKPKAAKVKQYPGAYMSGARLGGLFKPQIAERNADMSGVNKTDTAKDKMKRQQQGRKPDKKVTSIAPSQQGSGKVTRMPKAKFKGNWSGAAPSEMQKRGGQKIKRPNLLDLFKKRIKK